MVFQFLFNKNYEYIVQIVKIISSLPLVTTLNPPTNPPQRNILPLRDPTENKLF